MLLHSLLTLGIATVATYLSFNAQEEVFKVAMAFTALLFGLFTLFLAPWEIKVFIVILPLVLDKFTGWLTGNSGF